MWTRRSASASLFLHTRKGKLQDNKRFTLGNRLCTCQQKNTGVGVTIIAVSSNRFEVMPLLLGDTYGGKGISILIDLAIVSVDIKVVAATSTVTNYRSASTSRDDIV